MSETLIVRAEDIRAARLCFQGARPWFRRHGLDWQAFLAEGLPAEVLAATGDALALRVIAEAEKRAAQTQTEA
ncbi:hypothetical protein OEZ60_14985 [Defluviimonas sp. WL0024]|uniref:Uncharacterized protein n=1 Tax=Albidovulum salinarum TaxID=2984153 RepID=A0ABT2X5T6_9RHOB|nr:hypothetical protein [Defluviimonas sp. WL0024]MCU9849306.1 hypothetical protein [Defluviimonas sp. WL0024]